MFESARDSLPVLRAWLANYAAAGQPTARQGPPRADEATYAAMDASEKYAYARRFPQQALDHGRRKP
jgi:hypothetical protein